LRAPCAIACIASIERSGRPTGLGDVSLRVVRGFRRDALLTKSYQYLDVLTSAKPTTSNSWKKLLVHSAA